MSFNVHWDIDKYRDEHESEDHWQLRRCFMAKWKNNYPEDRLVCLARVFTNIEFMGCRYTPEVMKEIAGLSQEVAKAYRQEKKTKLQRTFVSASDAAEDRAKGVKRQGGVIIDDVSKSARIQFIAAGASEDNDNRNDHNIEFSSETNDNREQNDNNEKNDNSEKDESIVSEDLKHEKKFDLSEYLEDLSKINCMDVRYFRDDMFGTVFGKLVLMIRPWASKLWNIQTSCQVCNIILNMAYVNQCMTLTINGQIIAQATGESKLEARNLVGNIAWERMINEVISLLVKEQFIAQNDTRVTVSDVSMKKIGDDVFGTPVENSVATKMMKMMGWKGGGLGADSQGISEPIKPNLQMVNRQGLGSNSSDIREFRKAAYTLMERYLTCDTIDLDLVFSSEFSKDERALLHKCAQMKGLASRSYGVDKERFLVIKKKMNPFSLVKAVIEKGGTSSKYQVFIPSQLASRSRR